MRPTQQAKKALSIPKLLNNLEYWKSIKSQLIKDLTAIIEAKAKAAAKPPKSDLLAMSEKEARNIMYWANQNLLEANTLYTVKIFMDTLMDACYVSLMALKTEYMQVLEKEIAEKEEWKQLFLTESDANKLMTQVALKYAELNRSKNNAA